MQQYLFNRDAACPNALVLQVNGQGAMMGSVMDGLSNLLRNSQGQIMEVEKHVQFNTLATQLEYI